MKKITLLFGILFTIFMNAQTGIVQVGSNSGATSTTTYPSPLADYYKNSRQQFLYTASELAAAGLAAGPITELGWNVVTVGTSGIEKGYTISLKTTTLTALTTTFETGAATVYGPTDFTPSATGNVLFTLSSAFNWDGTSNLIVEICEGDTTNASFTTNVQTVYSTLTYNGSVYYRSDSTAACPSLTGTTATTRPQLVVNGTLASCVSPTSIVASNISTNSADVSWTASATPPANGYEYYVSSTNNSPTSGTTPTGSVGAGVTTANLTSLSSATTYYVWVRSVCSGSDTSSWSASGNFTTLCGLVTSFYEDFESTTGALFPTCWAKIGTGGLSNTQASTGISGARNLYIYGSSATSQAVVAMTPVSNSADGTHQFRAKVRANFTAGGTLEFGYLTNPTDDTTFVALGSITTNSTTVAQDFLVSPVTTPAGVTTLALRHVGNVAYSILVDNVYYEQIPTCIEPTVLVASNITTTSADVSWTASVTPPANGYEYYVSTTNTAPTSGTVATGSVGAGVTTLNLTGLTSSTTYFVWIRSVCSGSDSSVWSSFVTFSTTCTASTIPYTQDFESAVAPAIPNCTSIENAGTGNNWTVANNPGYGFTSNTLRYNYNLSNPANAWFYTNGISLTGGTYYTISYRYGNNSTTYKENLSVTYGTSASSTAMINILADHPNITGGTTTSTGTVNSVNFTPSADGVYYFGFNAYSIANQFALYVDDISITTTLSNTSFESTTFKAYPNPVKDVLNIGYAKNISKVAIYNILGQEVVKQTVNANESQVNVSNLLKGTYLVKITAEDGASKTIKVIKE